jgi:phosphatidylglycerophosphate synthase
MFSEIADIYRDSRKPEDIFWNVYVARPLAAVLVYALRRTPITPNQVTFLGAAVFIGVAAALIALPGWTGILVAAVILEFSYVLDCADGQLARLTGMTSDIGAYLDFLMDEFKALVLVGAFSVRIWMETDAALWLLVGLGGMALVSFATSLTTFVRREEYAGERIRPGESARRTDAPDGVVARVVWLVQRLASWLVHYPSWFVYIALLDGVQGFDGSRWFLYLFLGVYTLYVAKTGLAVVWKLGRRSYYDSNTDT